jgi:predicted O-methyltransferase YrrM
MHDPVTPFDVLIATVIFLLLGNFLLSAYVLHKVRRVHLMSFDIRNAIERMSTNGQLFWQLQALDGLYRDLKFTRALPLTRGWAASPDFLAILARHALDHRPRAVVECGSGVSTVILARCMQLNGAGRVFSFDHDARFAEETRRNLERHGLSEWAEVIHAPLQKHAHGADEWNWYDTRNLPDVRIDMLVVDGPPMPLGKMIRYPAGPVLFPRLSSSAAVFMDDADRDDERQIVDRWIAENPGFRVEKVECEKGCALLRSERPAEDKDKST